MKSLHDHESVRPSGSTGMDGENGEGWSGVIGNERLTALAGAGLLVLIVVELVTVANLRAGLAIHVLIGVLLAGPLAVKLGSTGYRFLRYYTGSPAYVRKGPPRLPLRGLAPLLLLTTLVVIGSGIGLVVTGPLHPGPLLLVHGMSTLLWLPLIAFSTHKSAGPNEMAPFGSCMPRALAIVAPVLCAHSVKKAAPRSNHDG